jgi:DNA-binding NtrC family response regulator
MDKILIVDDESYIREELAEILGEDERQFVFASDGLEGLSQLEKHDVDLVISDIRMPRMDGFEFIKKAHERKPSLLIITITAFASTETAVQALRAGAYDYVTKPFSIDEVRNIVDNALCAYHLFNEVNYLRGRLAQRYSMENIIGQCELMQRVFETISRVSTAPCSILITGESGTGKDLVAQAIHEKSGRKGKFVPINCAGIPEGLLESELFGHVKGSFSGAVREKEGLVQTASKGTLFLDEIADMPMSLQVKLLRLIQQKQVQKVGSTHFEDVDVRIITATNQSLIEKIEQNSFRKDLYYRINVVEISLPPLRARGADMSLLISHFVKKYCSKLGKHLEKISPEVISLFQRYPWPGNVRELENAIERAVTLSKGQSIEIEDIPSSIIDYFNSRAPQLAGSLAERVEAFELSCIKHCLAANENDMAKAAEQLDVSLATLYRKAKKLKESRDKVIPILEIASSSYQFDSIKF